MDLEEIDDPIEQYEAMIKMAKEADKGVRARQAEDKLLELTAGPVATDAQPDPVSDTP